ncbi:hypothetical protein BKA70DRAFT_1576430 [Coprinopsis sp. MPI-PUGE-AT-0042]|nr:hypothetical protein BKA70DRAFT_1576430 [Coprinopsis sp. MPI-PUGE-AT-0042]
MFATTGVKAKASNQASNDAHGTWRLDGYEPPFPSNPQVASNRAKPSMVYLPHELRLSIAQELEEDTTSLQILALVDSDWSSSASSLLFKRIHVGDSDPGKRCQRLLEIFQRRPDLSTCVEALDITGIMPATAQGDPGDPWLEHTPTAPITILTLLLSVRAVSLQGRGFWEGQILWDDVSPDFKIAFLDLCARPHVNAIKLDCIVAIPIVPFIYFHQIRSLSLHRIHYPRTYTLGVGAGVDEIHLLDQIPALYPLDNTPQGAPASHLLELSLSHSHQAWVYLLHAHKRAQDQTADGEQCQLLSFSRSIPWDEEEIALEKLYFQCLHETCARDVQTLQISHQYMPFKELQPHANFTPRPEFIKRLSLIFNFTPYQSLTTLGFTLRPKLSHHTVRGSATEDALLNGLTQLATQRPPSPLQVLQVLQVNISLPHPFVFVFGLKPWPVTSFLATENFFHRLDSVMSSRSAFCSLRQVEIAISDLEPGISSTAIVRGEECSRVKSEVERRFPELGRLGQDKLSVEVSFSKS